jgi:alpha-N-arabinofuranosidase
MAALATGRVLRPEVKAPTYDTARYGEVLLIDTAATFDDEQGELSVFVVNRHPSEEVGFSVDLRAFPGARLDLATVLSDDDWRAANTLEEPNRVTPRPHPHASVEDGALRVVLPAVSWNVFRLATNRS